jgi:hypothetical protein
VATTNALFNRIVNFSREPRESLSDYLSRAERLYSRLRTDNIRKMLANNVLVYIADDQTDIKVQERVIDRLAN